MAGSDGVLRVGTRGSDLARWQAAFVIDAIRKFPGSPVVEEVIIKTEGDRIIDIPLSQVEGKAFFTKEIEEALLTGEVDLAVHSLKDLLVLVLERAACAEGQWSHGGGVTWSCRS